MTGTEHPESTQRRHRRMTAILAVLGALALLGPIVSRAAFSASTSNTGRVAAAKDWAAPTVEITDPGDGIRGTVTISANATDDGLGVASVSLAWAPSGTTTFTVLCTDTTAPYSCPFTTTSLPEEEVDIRAIATDRAGFIATELLEGVLVDNVAPSGSVGTIPTLTGVVTIPVTATDAGTGVASVTIQRAPTLTTTWTTICVDIDAPYSCRFDTATVPTGTILDFRALVADGVGNTATTAVVRTKTVSNLADSVSVDDPGPYLRGSATINANAASVLGVASVKIQRQAAGSGTWVDLCTDTVAPYSCVWDTTTVADGPYSFRAILTPNAGPTTTSATVGPSQVDNTPVRGYDVQGGTVTGTAGRIGPGDSFNVTYTRLMQPSSVLAGWTGTSQAVVVRLRDGGLLGRTGSDDTIDVFTTTNFNTPVNLGSVNLRGNHVKSKKTAAFNATMTMQTVTVNGSSATKITITITALVSGSVRTAGGTPTMIWTPSALALGVAGGSTSTAPITELGTADRDV